MMCPWSGDPSCWDGLVSNPCNVVWWRWFWYHGDGYNILIEAMLYHCWLVQLSKTVVSLVFFLSGLNRTASLSTVYLMTFLVKAVHTLRLPSQVILHRISLKNSWIAGQLFYWCAWTAFW